MLENINLKNPLIVSPSEKDWCLSFVHDLALISHFDCLDDSVTCSF